MGRVAIAEENRTGEGGNRFPAIELTQKGDKTRFTVIEIPWREYIHYLKAPEFDDDGKPKMETKEKKDGEKYTTTKLTFLGQPICLGDEEILKSKGIDPDNCPACKASVDSGGDIPGPTQRFAVNVIEYSLRGNSFDLKEPFSADIKIWKFSGRIYDEIEGIQKEIGDLRRHDLTLECEDAYWKRNKLAFKMESGLKQAPSKQYVQQLLKTPGNMATEEQLRDACGRAIPRSRLQDDVDHVLRLYRKLRNEGNSDGYKSGPADLEGGIEALLGDEEGGASATDMGDVSGDPWADDLDSIVGQQTSASETKAADDDPFAEFTPETTSNPSSKAVDVTAAASAQATATPRSAPRSEAKDAAAAESGRKAAAAAQAKKDQAAKEAAASDDFNFDNLLEDL